MIARNKYLNQLMNVRENGFPKVITGIRRCGKSLFSKMIINITLTKYSLPLDCGNGL